MKKNFLFIFKVFSPLICLTPFVASLTSCAKNTKNDIDNSSVVVKNQYTDTKYCSWAFNNASNFLKSIIGSILPEQKMNEYTNEINLLIHSFSNSISDKDLKNFILSFEINKDFLLDFTKFLEKLLNELVGFGDFLSNLPNKENIENFGDYTKVDVINLYKNIFKNNEKEINEYKKELIKNNQTPFLSVLDSVFSFINIPHTNFEYGKDEAFTYIKDTFNIKFFFNVFAKYIFLSYFQIPSDTFISKYLKFNFYSNNYLNDIIVNTLISSFLSKAVEILQNYLSEKTTIEQVKNEIVDIIKTFEIFIPSINFANNKTEIENTIKNTLIQIKNAYESIPDLMYENFVNSIKDRWDTDPFGNVTNGLKSDVALSHTFSYENPIWKKIKKGDILVYGMHNNNATIGHIGIYAGVKILRGKEVHLAIEAGNAGVQYQAIDDSNIGTDLNPSIEIFQYPVEFNREKVIDFATSQIGCNYNVPIVLCFGNYNQIYEEKKGSWFCSEIVHTSYLQAGIDINLFFDKDTYFDPGCTPRNILRWCLKNTTQIH